MGQGKGEMTSIIRDNFLLPIFFYFLRPAIKIFLYHRQSIFFARSESTSKYLHFNIDHLHLMRTENARAYIS